MRAPYRIIERSSKSGKSTFIIRFQDSSGAIIKSMALPGVRTRSGATRAAEAEVKRGIIAADDNPPAMEFLLNFWTRESDYVRGREARGIAMAEGYLRNNRSILERHFRPYLEGKRMSDIDIRAVETAILGLTRARVGPRTINYGLQAITVPMRYFCRMRRIPNPLGEVEKVADKPKPRGTLSVAEISTIIAMKGSSPRARAAVLLAALAGMRIGEIRGLRWENIDLKTNLINVVENWVDGEGIKAPKAGSARLVPLPGPVLAALELCRDIAPRGTRFVIFNEATPANPVSEATLRDGFWRMLALMGIDADERKTRNLTFHGLRHTFVSLARAQGLPDFVSQALAGHKSSRMMDHYSHGRQVIDFEAARKAMEAAVG